MTSRITPKLASHSGQSPGGKELPYLCSDYQVKGQGEPTPDRPIGRRKAMRGEGEMPKNLENFK